MNVLKPLRILAILTIAFILSSCRGQPFKKQPIHLNPNMDQQKRMEAQEVNKFFADNRSMRQPPEGTVSRGHLKNNTVYYDGKNKDGSFVNDNPIKMTKAFINRGRNRFNIYCTPCHGQKGDGKGIVMVGQYGYVPAPSYHTDRIRNFPDGQIYDVIKNGVRTMPSYGSQVPVRDRWAIVAYIRALQKSEHATTEEVESFGVSVEKLNQEYEKRQQAQAKKDSAQKAQQQQQGGAEVSAEHGKEIFKQNACHTCHSTDGSKGVGPSLKGVFGHETTLNDGSTVTADESYIEESIRQPNAKVVQGFQPVMPNLTSSLSDADINSLVEYIKTLK